LENLDSRLRENDGGGTGKAKFNLGTRSSGEDEFRQPGSLLANERDEKAMDSVFFVEAVYRLLDSN